MVKSRSQEELKDVVLAGREALISGEIRWKQTQQIPQKAKS